MQQADIRQTALKRQRGLIPRYFIIAYALLAVFWVASTYSFLLELVSFSLSEAMQTPVNLLLDAVIVCLGCVTLRNRTDKLLIAIFTIYTLVDSIIVNGQGIVMWANGIREYIGLLFMLPIVRYLLGTPDRCRWFIPLFDRSLYIFLWVQWPCMIFQYVAFGGWDYGGGSLGAKGFSGIISTLIFVASFYLMMRRWDYSKGYLSNLRHNWVLIFLLGPTMLNETKVSFVYILLYLFFLVPFDRKYLKRLILVSILSVVCLGGAAAFYLSVTDVGNQDIFSAEYLREYVEGGDEAYEMAEAYMLNNVDYEQGEDFARGVKIASLPAVIDDKPWGPWLGYGIGLFKGGSAIQKSRFALDNEWFCSGTQMMFMIWLLELGTVGMLWIIAFSFHLFGFRSRRNGQIRKRELTWFMAMIFIIIFIYNSAFLYPAFYIIFIYIAYLSAHWEDTLHNGTAATAGTVAAAQ